MNIFPVFYSRFVFVEHSAGGYFFSQALKEVTIHFPFQNTNGVNFYNILTQEPEEERASLAQDHICEAARCVTVLVLFRWLFRNSNRVYSPALQVQRHVRRLHRQSLSQLMNGQIRKKLGIIPQNVTWGGL